MGFHGIKIGSLGQDSLDNIILGFMEVATGKYSTLIDKDGAAIQVAANKTFYIVNISCNGSANNTYFKLGYGDTSVSNSDNAPTNHKIVLETIYLANDYEQYNFTVIAPIPANKYPCISSGTGTTSINCTALEI